MKKKKMMNWIKNLLGFCQEEKCFLLGEFEFCEPHVVELIQNAKKEGYEEGYNKGIQDGTIS